MKNSNNESEVLKFSLKSERNRRKYQHRYQQDVILTPLLRMWMTTVELNRFYELYLPLELSKEVYLPGNLKKIKPL